MNERALWRSLNCMLNNFTERAGFPGKDLEPNGCRRSGNTDGNSADRRRRSGRTSQPGLGPLTAIDLLNMLSILWSSASAFCSKSNDDFSI